MTMMLRDFYTALTLDGSNDKVAGTNALALSAFTLAAWVRRTKNSATQPIVSGGANSASLRVNSNNGFELAKAGVGVVGAASANEVVRRFEFVHLCATYDGTTVRLYFNGAKVVEAAASQTFASSTYGVGTDNTNFFGGTVDDALIYDSVLSDAEVARIAMVGPEYLPKPRVLDWRFDDAIGSSVADASSTGNVGTITEANFSRIAPASAPFLDRNMGLCGDFNGSNARVDLGAELTNAVLAGASAVTAMCWFRITNPWQVGRFFGAMTSASNAGVLIWTTGTTNTQQLGMSGRSKSTDSSVAIVLNPILEPGNWMHFAGVFDFANKVEYAYVNGILRATADASSWGGTSFESNSVGGHLGGYSGGDYFKGQIDDIRVYTRALSKREIRHGYLSGIWPKDRPALLWTFDEGTAANSGAQSVTVTPQNMAYRASFM